MLYDEQQVNLTTLVNILKNAFLKRVKFAVMLTILLGFQLNCLRSTESVIFFNILIGILIMLIAVCYV